VSYSLIEYPEDSIQHWVEPWWIRKPAAAQSTVERWDLIVALVPFLGEIPYRVQELTRKSDRDHTRADFSVAEFGINTTYHKPDLPLAAIPEPQYMFPGKVRPALVIGHIHERIPKAIRDQASWQTRPSYLLAPYFGVEADGNRAGWPLGFVDRIRQAGYPQYFWDHLPPGLPLLKQSGCTSVMRLDQTYPSTRKPAVYVPTGWALSVEAQKVIKDWIRWQIGNSPTPNGPIDEFRKILKEL